MKFMTSLLIFLFQGTIAFSQLSVEQLFVENRGNPIGLDTDQPRFTWVMSSAERDKKQSAYQIRVAGSANDLTAGSNLIWDSEKVESDQSVFVPFAGPALESGKRYYWQVRVWDEQGSASDWSQPAFWQMGLLDPANEFSASWISPAFEESEQRESPYFRKEFSLAEKDIERAMVYVTAHGMYEAWLNGERVGDAYLTPGWTSYDDRLQYQVYDVTDLVRSGDNAVGAVLGNGWYRGYLAWGDQKDHYGSDIALLLQLEVTYLDGTRDVILSDKSWESSKGPVLFSEIYDGEIYDSRKEMVGWASPGFQGVWSGVRTMDFQKDHLIATYNEPIREQERLEPVSIQRSPEGDLIVDFGQNLVGWVQLKVSGASGDQIDLYHAEVLDKEGNFYTKNLRDADQKVTYILDGSSDQVLEPHFTFQGFRYVKVEGFPGELQPENLTSIALYSDMRPTGEFSCSDPLINQLQQNIQWGQKGNFLDVPTDCPQRDERLGWTGDAQAFFRTAAYNMNVNNFFSKWMKDVAADQKENGAVPFVVPNVLGENAAGSAGWADVATIIPWEAYLLYGDKRMLETQYPSMKAWVEYIRSRSEDNLWNSGFHFGDWLFYSPDDDRDGRAAITDKYFITQCFYAYSTQLLINAAKALGYDKEDKEYSALLSDIKKAFQREFMSPSGRLGPNTQTAYVLALQFDLLPENLRAQAAQRLVDNIRSYGYHLTTGFLGTPYLCHVLSRFGHEDMAYELLLQDTYPSWLYPVTMGATTIWERWDGIKPDSTFQTPSMNSYNHYAYGAIGDWMYRNVAGINALASDPGYKKILIRPIPGGGLTEAQGQLETYYGTMGSSWKIGEDQVLFNVQIPVNTSAEVYIPATSAERVTESGMPLVQVEGLEVLGTESGYVKVAVGSGDYSFTIVQLPMSKAEQLNEYAGIYEAYEGFGSEITIEQDGGKLYLVLDGRREPLTSKDEDYFVFESDSDNIVRFERSRTKAIRSVYVEANPLRIRAAKN